MYIYLLLMSFCSLRSCWHMDLVPKKIFSPLCDAQKCFLEEFESIKKYVKSDNINKAPQGSNCSFVTHYFDQIKPNDIHIENKIIAYFFSQGLNFSGEQQVKEYSPVVFNHILKNKYIDETMADEDKIKQFENSLLLTRVCLYQKIKHSAIPKTIVFFYKILKAFNNKKDCLIKIPKSVFGIIISKHLLGHDTSLQDIAGSLSRTKKRLAIAHNDSVKKELFMGSKNNYGLFSSILMVSLHEWATYHTRNLGIYQNNIPTLKMLDSLEWHNNTLIFFKHLYDEFNEK